MALSLSTLKSIPLHKLSSDPAQPRTAFDEEELHRLASNLKLHGQLVPLIVLEQGSGYILIDGERRYRAAKIAGLTELRCFVATSSPDADELLTIQLTINTQRQDLNPIERMGAYQKLMRLKGWNSTELAEHLSVSKSMVTRILALEKLTATEQQLVAEGKIGSADAYSITRLNDEVREAASQLAKEGKLGREALEKLGRKAVDSAVKKRMVRLEFGLFSGSFQSEQAFTLPELIDWLSKAVRECKRAAKTGLDVTTLSRVLADRSRFDREGGEAC